MKTTPNDNTTLVSSLLLLITNLPSILFQWGVTPSSESEVACADVILTQEFGNLKDISTATRAMAELAVKLSEQFNIPVICQYPGDAVLLENNIIPVLVISKNLKNPNAHLDTQEVDRQANIFCKEKSWKKVINIAHPDHIWRVDKNIKSFGLTSIIPSGLSKIPYDKNCSRRDVSTPWLWRPREVLVRIMYYMKGYMAF